MSAAALVGGVLTAAGFATTVWETALPPVATIALPLGALQGITQGALLGLFMVLVGVATWRMTGQEWVSGVPGAGR